MDATIVMAVCSLAGTALGTLGGILASNRLTNHRISELEKKVEKHNNVVERLLVVEQSVKSAHHRLDMVCK